MYVLRSGAFMQTDKKIDLVRQLLLAFGVRKNEAGIQWAKAFNREEGLRRQLDPSGKFYDRNRTMRMAVRRKLEAMPNDVNQPVKKIEELVSVIAPNATSKFDGLREGNVKGAYRGLILVAEQYPEVTAWLTQYSSVSGAKKVAKGSVAAASEKLEETDQVLSFKRELDLWKKDQDRHLEWALGSSAIYVASSYSVAGRAPVKRWMETHGGKYAKATKELFDIVVNTSAEKSLKDYITKTAKRTSDVYVPKDTGYYACLNPGHRGIWISNKVGGKYDYDECVKRDVESGFHPAVDEKYHGATSVMVHELGHALDFMTDAHSDPEILEIWNSPEIHLPTALSRYGATNPHEMIAEAFMEFMLNKEPRDVARRIGERLTKLYTEKYGEPIPAGELK